MLTKHPDVTGEELGILAAKIIRKLEPMRGFTDDPITIESSCGDELMPLVADSAYKNAKAVIYERGLSVSDFFEAVSERVSARWIYENLGDFEQMAMDAGDL